MIIAKDSFIVFSQAVGFSLDTALVVGLQRSCLCGACSTLWHFLWVVLVWHALWFFRVSAFPEDPVRTFSRVLVLAAETGQYVQWMPSVWLRASHSRKQPVPASSDWHGS